MIESIGSLGDYPLGLVTASAIGKQQVAQKRNFCTYDRSGC